MWDVIFHSCKEMRISNTSNRSHFTTSTCKRHIKPPNPLASPSRRSSPGLHRRFAHTNNAHWHGLQMFVHEILDKQMVEILWVIWQTSCHPPANPAAAPRPGCRRSTLEGLQALRAQDALRGHQGAQQQHLAQVARQEHGRHLARHRLRRAHTLCGSSFDSKMGHGWRRAGLCG